MFKSKLEVRISKELKKQKAQYEVDAFDYVIKKKYVCDFTVPTKHGPVYLEVKGYFSQEDRAKMRAVKECNPNIDIRLVFDRDNKLSKKSKMTYGEWADKYGFPYAIGGVPKGWFDV